MKKLFLTLIAISMLTIPTYAQRDFSDVTITVHPVGGSVFMLEGAGGNIGVSAGDDGILMIDDQFAPLAQKIESALDSLNPGELKFLLNTHVHGDHVGGNSHFGPQTTIVAHTNIRKRMIDEYNEAEDKSPVQGKDGWPVVTFDNSLSIHFNGEEIKMIHLPHGHTDGDAVVHFTKSNVIHVGDLLFNGMFPYVDLGNGGTVDGYIENVKHLLQMIPDDITIIAGHGPIADKPTYTSFLNMLESTVSIIRDARANGVTMEDLQKQGLGDEWTSWSWSFVPTERWIETIYNDSK